MNTTKYRIKNNESYILSSRVSVYKTSSKAKRKSITRTCFLSEYLKTLIKKSHQASSYPLESIRRFAWKIKFPSSVEGKQNNCSSSSSRSQKWRISSIPISIRTLGNFGAIFLRILLRSCRSVYVWFIQSRRRSFSFSAPLDGFL